MKHRTMIKVGLPIVGSNGEDPYRDNARRAARDRDHSVCMQGASVHSDPWTTPAKFSLELVEFGTVGTDMGANRAGFEAQVVWDIFKFCYLYTRQVREYRFTYYPQEEEVFSPCHPRFPSRLLN